MPASLIQPDSKGNCCNCSRDGCADCAECEQLGNTLSVAVTGITPSGCAPAAPEFAFTGCTMTALATGLNGVFTCTGNYLTGWDGPISDYPQMSATIYQTIECEGQGAPSNSSSARLTVTCADGDAPDYAAMVTVLLVVDWYVVLGTGAAGIGYYTWQGTGLVGSAITITVFTAPGSPTYALSNGIVTVTQA